MFAVFCTEQNRNIKITEYPDGNQTVFQKRIEKIKDSVFLKEVIKDITNPCFLKFKAILNKNLRDCKFIKKLEKSKHQKIQEIVRLKKKKLNIK